MRFLFNSGICFGLSVASTLIVTSIARGELSARGMTLAHLHNAAVGYGSEPSRTELDKLAVLNANWIAINPYAYMRSVDSPAVRFGNDRTMPREAIVRVIQDARERKLSVMIKPHVWSGDFMRGKWHGDIAMKSEADWDVWFGDYSNYLISLAEIARVTQAEALCIGCELQGTTGQTARWKKLIAEIRKIYPGKLVYAAAFGEFSKIEFWDDIDVVGINAYWKLADSPSASEAQIRAGWAKVYDELSAFKEKIDKPIWFTELGYSQSRTAAMEPWSYEVKIADPALRERLFTIAIEEADKSKIVSGVFLWKWFTAADWQRHERSDAFAIQDTPELSRAIQRAWTKK